MNRDAPVDHPIHDLLQRRWSPYVFDSSRTVTQADLTALFEAARWTMSSYNAQPWRFIVGVKDRNPAVWEKVLSVLLEGNQVWAQHAPVLGLGLAERKFEYNGKENKAAVHDLGAASASLTFEATARGISVHQMIGIDPDRARQVFEVPASVEPFTGIAIGYAGDTGAEDLAKRDERKRERKALSELILHGGF